MRRIFAVVAALCTFLVSLAAGSPAQSVNNDTLSVYYDAPFVQSSYISGTSNTLTETFDSATPGACPTNLAVGTLTGTCSVVGFGQYGGAMSQFVGGAAIPVGDPATGTNATVGTGTNYATTVSPATMSIALAPNSKYFGLWWSAGSPSNQIQFYSGQNLVITLTTQTIMSQFGTVPNPWPGNNTFTAIDNTTYNKGWYFGNPRGYKSTSPTAASTITSGEPFVYLHLFAAGSLTFDRVVLSGSGFEFDNLTVSTATQTPRSSLVLAQTIVGNKTVSFNNNQGTGTMAAQVANSSTALTANSFSRTGYSFTGWNTQADGQGTSYTNQQVYSFDANLELFAQWQPIPYNVTYNTQGGSSVAGETYTIGSTITLPQPPSRTGYTFTGWYTSGTGGSPLGSTYNPPGVGAITLFAQWEPIVYSVTYDSQGGTGVPGESYTVGSSITLPQPPARTGYTFTGWYTSSSGGSPLGSTYSPPGVGNITLYAHWQSNGTVLASTGNSQISGFWGLMIIGLSGASLMLASAALKRTRRTR